MRKLLSIVLVLVLIFALSSCGDAPQTAEQTETVTETTIKAGLICLHDENSGYDANFINGFKDACAATGVDCLIKTNVPETSAAYDAAIDLVESGCSVIFSDSYGHQQFMMQAAQEVPAVQLTS